MRLAGPYLNVNPICGVTVVTSIIYVQSMDVSSQRDLKTKTPRYLSGTVSLFYTCLVEGSSLEDTHLAVVCDLCWFRDSHPLTHHPLCFSLRSLCPPCHLSHRIIIAVEIVLDLFFLECVAVANWWLQCKTHTATHTHTTWIYHSSGNFLQKANLLITISPREVEGLGLRSQFGSLAP